MTRPPQPPFRYVTSMLKLRAHKLEVEASDEVSGKWSKGMFYREQAAECRHAARVLEKIADAMVDR